MILIMHVLARLVWTATNILMKYDSTKHLSLNSDM